MATVTSTAKRVPMWNRLSAPSLPARDLFVWGTWALLFLAALAFVWKYSHDIPVWDDWNLVVPVVTGQQPPTVSWLWQQYCQHRFPFPKLILHAGQMLGVTDIRATLYFNVCALGILALLMIGVAKRLRGRTSYADAFFPLALLHWGRPEIFLVCQFFYYVIPMVLAGILLLVTVGWGTQVTLGSAVLAGICLVLLPLSGAVGMLCVPLPILWLGYVGIGLSVSPERTATLFFLCQSQRSSLASASPISIPATQAANTLIGTLPFACSGKGVTRIRSPLFNRTPINGWGRDRKN